MRRFFTEIGHLQPAGSVYRNNMRGMTYDLLTIQKDCA